jgi:hypothetical protein
MGAEVSIGSHFGKTAFYSRLLLLRNIPRILLKYIEFLISEGGYR